MKQENRRHDIEITSGGDILFLLAYYDPFVQRGGGHVKVPHATFVYGNSPLAVGDYISLEITQTGFYAMGGCCQINKQNGDAIRVGMGFHRGDISAFKANPTLVDLSYDDLIEYHDIWGAIEGTAQHLDPNLLTGDFFEKGDIWSLVTLSSMHDSSGISFGEQSFAWIYFLGTEN